MKATMLRAGVLAALVGVAALSGCAKENPKAESKAAAVAQTKPDDHSAWWCAEHGVPEHDCAQCSAKVAAEYKKKGDWCKEHERPESQCFLCHPDLREKFAAQYRAKYGKEPPPTEDEGKAKNAAKDGKK